MIQQAALDVYAFMDGCDQITPQVEPRLVQLYANLVREEIGELEEGLRNLAFAGSDEALVDAKAEVLDAILDSVWVLLGLGITLQLPLTDGWEEVSFSNFNKLDPETGKVIKNKQGKVMKPEGWQPPNLKQIIESMNGTPY